MRHIAVAALGFALFGGAAAAAEAYPFEGTWIRADRVCAPATVRARVYSAREVVSPLGRCAIRRVASSSNTFELLEECRRNDRSQSITETIRLTTPDAMTLKRQVSRLKIPRQVHYVRCNVAGGPASPPPPARPPRQSPPAEPKG